MHAIANSVVLITVLLTACSVNNGNSATSNSQLGLVRTTPMLQPSIPMLQRNHQSAQELLCLSARPRFQAFRGRLLLSYSRVAAVAIHLPTTPGSGRSTTRRVSRIGKSPFFRYCEPALSRLQIRGWR